MSAAAQNDDAGVQSSLEEVWYLKQVSFQPSPDAPPKQLRIITQNFNGPCSFIAICNILILRGDIDILPPDRTAVSYEFLSQLVAEYLLRACPDVDISAALSIMPVTRKGMDLNPLFTATTAFRPAGAGGELKLFEQAGIKLVHGWLADPDSPEYRVLAKTEDYDTSVNLIVEADHVSKGRLVTRDDDDHDDEREDEERVSSSSNHAGPSSTSAAHDTLTDEERQKVEDAIIIRRFIDTTQSQLTYHGLFALASTLPPGALVALFRNSHLSVLHKSAHPSDSALYTLVTDQVFLHEPSVVWERLEDVDGGWSTFVDSEFARSAPVGGDYAGYTAEMAVLEAEAAAMTMEERSDQELARQLQAQEDQRAREMRAEQEARERERAVREERIAAVAQEAAERRKSKKKECVVM